ncbi:MAG: hypothetical protein PHU25_09700, partial [Deltaproteobacteria bacterium]|nr:hypothetical protein [Deltaproteobacteria bacterium]
DLISQSRDGADSYFHTDGLGSTRALTDGAGEATDSYTYDAYGELAASAGSTPNPYLFTGEQRDAETGNYYLRARYYAPEAGAFVNGDEWAGIDVSPISWNRYLYGIANPVLNTDPSGEMVDVLVTVAILSALVAIPHMGFAEDIKVTASDKPLLLVLHADYPISFPGEKTGRQGSLSTFSLTKTKAESLMKAPLSSFYEIDERPQITAEAADGALGNTFTKDTLIVLFFHTQRDPRRSGDFWPTDYGRGEWNVGSSINGIEMQEPAQLRGIFVGTCHAGYATTGTKWQNRITALEHDTYSSEDMANDLANWLDDKTGRLMKR